MLYTSIKKIKDPVERKRVIDKLITLRAQLDKEIPEKTSFNSLLLATWNIRKFGEGRMAESYFYIAEIISRFDLVAIQEVMGNRKALEKIMPLLGRQWDYIVTDSTEGKSGAQECMAFVYDTTKVRFKNLAGEIVLPKDKLIGDEQFARTPFCVAFQAGWFKFNLSTGHIYYGTTSKINQRRLKEIDTIAKFLTKRAKKEKLNYVLLGDFNIPDVDCDYMKALENNGFYIPDAIKEHPTDLGNTNHYDQIAFNLQLSDSMVIFKEKQQKAGAFNFTESVFTADETEVYRPYFDEEYQNLDKKEAKKYYNTTYRTFQMSDHLPLWVQLKVDFSAQYLEDLSKGVTTTDIPVSD